jgi:hypothetical protein
MASKATLKVALFDQLTSFITELSEMYPEDPDFSLFLTTIRMMKTANPALLLKHLSENVLQYETPIMSKDESFFLQNSFDDYAGDVDMNIIAKLKQYVAQMSPSSKESVWKYVQNITRLIKACRD